MNVMLGALPSIALALSLAYSSGAGAQVGSTTDILMGRVAGLDSQAVAGARVEATSAQSPAAPSATSIPISSTACRSTPSDLAALAALAPGVVAVPGSDTTKASFSVAGQPANQNNITLDGLSFGAGSVPQEAVRNTRVVTSTYDVARGQFTGGQVASTTRGGTNNVQGALSYSRRDPNLELVDDTNPAFGQKYKQNQISFGAGGPIIKDNLFTLALSHSPGAQIRSFLCSPPIL